jgi:hypothetical protein
MTDELQIDGTTVIEKDGSGNIIIKNANSVSTEEVTITEMAAALHTTANQTIPTGKDTQVAFNSQTFDRGGDVLNPDGANDRITIEKNGLYLLRGTIVFSSPGDGTRILAKVLADSTIIDQGGGPTGADDFSEADADGLLEVSSPPVQVTLDVFQNSGSDKSLAGSRQNVRLEVARIG